MRACDIVMADGRIEYCVEVDGIVYPFSEEIRDHLMYVYTDEEIKSKFFGLPASTFPNIFYKESNVLH